MTIIGFYGSSEIEGWRMKLSKYLNDFTIVDLVSAEGEQADIALVWAPPAGQLKKMPNLRGIIMQGQGVDYMMADTTVPRDVPLVRLVDPDMSNALVIGRFWPHWISGVMRRIIAPVRLLRTGTPLCNAEQVEPRLVLWVLEQLADLWRSGLPALDLMFGAGHEPASD